MKLLIKEAVKNAMRAKEQLKLNTLRGLLAAFQYEEMQKGKEDLSSEEQIAILKNEIKKRQEAIEMSGKAGRAEEVENAKIEIGIIETYLPQQMTVDQIKQILAEYKAQNLAGNLGQAMKLLKEKHNGAYDGRAASEAAKAIFG